MIAISRLSASASIVKGSTKAGIAVTANALKVLEPIILPITISASFFKAAAIEAANSGKLVPTATIVRPMNKSEAPNILLNLWSLLPKYLSLAT